jgi:hypothetical protein
VHRKILIIILLLCAFFSQTAFTDSYEEREGRGLEITSDPSNARVFINGIERGTTPFSDPNLMPGSYVVTLVRESYEDRQLVVNVPRRSRIFISLDMEKAMGTLVVQPKKSSDIPSWVPFNPQIYVDGEHQSKTQFSLPIGFRNVLVRAFGFEDASSTVMVYQDRTSFLEFEMKPALYRMSNPRVRRVRFNPANSGSLGMTESLFEINAPGKGTFKIISEQGVEVFSINLETFTSWSQSVLWNGRDSAGTIVPDGTYVINIDTESIPWDDKPHVRQSVSLSVEVDSSIQIFPESIASGNSGLLFAPGTDILPLGSYQLDALVLFGKAPATDKVWSNLPLAFSFRFSPFNFLEAAASLNVIPEFGDRTVIGVGASVKWQILKPKSASLGLATVLHYGWAQKGPITPFVMGTGLELAMPLSWSLGDMFVASLSPGVLWSGPKGYPESGVPSAILSAGLAYRYSIFNSGLSLRTEYFFNEGMSLGPVSFGGEIKIFPQPSILVISAIAGFSYENDSWGGFGGIGIGFIQ